MNTRIIPIALFIAVLGSAVGWASDDEAWLVSSRTPVLWAAAPDSGETGEESDLYDAGSDALDDQAWDQAISKFDKVIRMGGEHAPGAMYWKAYAQSKSAQQADALETLRQLREKYATSRWEREAKALELEIRLPLEARLPAKIRGESGGSVAPDTANDEELKLLILSNLMSTQPERTVPLLEKVLQGNSSPKVKEQALFVLSQSSAPEARGVLAGYAHSASDSDLQLRAVEYLGLYGGDENRRLLEDVYNSAASLEVKHKILEGYMMAGDGERLVAIAEKEKNAELRQGAIEQLGLMGDDDALWRLYQTENDTTIRQRILNSFMLSGADERLLQLARREKNVGLRRSAIEQLGLLGATDSLPMLYRNEISREVKSGIIDALFLHGDADGLIAIARTEKDHDLRREAVEKLSLLNSDAASDFLMELLNK